MDGPQRSPNEPQAGYSVPHVRKPSVLVPVYAGHTPVWRVRRQDVQGMTTEMSETFSVLYERQYARDQHSSVSLSRRHIAVKFGIR